jgi:hypothetical protein
MSISDSVLYYILLRENAFIPRIVNIK